MLSLTLAGSVLACGSGDLSGGGATSGAGAAGSGGSNTGNNVNSGGTGLSDCQTCVEQEVGVGTENPFDPDTHDSDGVGLDDEGALVLDQTQSGVPNIIWIANTGQNTVSKIDTTTFQELGRYRTGSNDPSRTSVNSLGDVFVGNRSGQSLTKISAAGEDCPDTNNDSQITTSTGPGNILPWGQDDCVLWNVPVPGNPLVRGVAAQDLVVDTPTPDDPHATSIERYVWLGGTSHRTVYKFDGDTGDLLVQTPAPTVIYGLALDGNGQLWMSGRQDSALGRVDTTQCVDASCDNAEICIRSCTTSGCVCTQCPTDCDQAIKERINFPSGDTVYGITVDYKQRVWMGGDQLVRRYDPAAPVSQRLTAVGVGFFIHGIAADGEGWIWGAGRSAGVRRLNGDDPLQNRTISIPDAKGMAVDKEGKIWAVSRGAAAHVIDPGAGLDDFTTIPNAVTGLVDCYTYSDMTGQQLALAANDPGYYREVFDGCPGDDTTWLLLDWEVETPANTSVRFKVRSAASADGLADENFFTVAAIPPDESPADLVAAFNTSGAEHKRFLEVEVWLKGTIDLNNGFISPRVLSFGVVHTCSPIIE